MTNQTTWAVTKIGLMLEGDEAVTAPVKVVNPRYASATPEDVARALVRPLRSPPSAGGKPVRRDKVTVQKPSPDKGGSNSRHLGKGV